LCAGFTGSDPVKERNRLWLIVDLERKLLRLQTIHELAFLIKDHHVGLDQFGIDANDIILLRRRSGFGLGLRRSNDHGAGHANKDPLEVLKEIPHKSPTQFFAGFKGN
jgi:hypothetical protein